MMKPAAKITGRLSIIVLLALINVSCVSAVLGVAVDTTVAVVKAPFQIAGAVIDVTTDTAGKVVAAPFKIVDAAVGGDGHHHHHDDDDDR